MPRPRRLIRRETIEPHVRRRRITYGYDIPSDLTLLNGVTVITRVKTPSL